MDTGGTTEHGSTTSLADALEALAGQCAPIDRIERVSPGAADGRVLAAPVAAERAVPHYERVTVDGWAVRAADTEDASDGSPTRLEPVGDEVTEGTAVRVHEEQAVPDGADAVVRIEAVDRRMEGLAVYESVDAGENVDPVGVDVPAGESLLDSGRRLAPEDLALCRVTGVTEVPVVEHPRIAVVATGDDRRAGDGDPAPGETVETDGLLVAQYCERWGATATKRDAVTDGVDALVEALERDADHDLVVTTGGSVTARQDVVSRAVREVGGMNVHGVAIDPGRPLGVGTVAGVDRETPILTLPNESVACLVGAVQFGRSAIGHLLGSDLPPMPTTPARLTRAIPSELGTRSFARVDRRSPGGPETLPAVEPLATAGGGVRPALGAADGWVEIPESTDGLPAEATVTVQHWDRTA